MVTRGNVGVRLNEGNGDNVGAEFTSARLGSSFSSIPTCL
jgi:hypothetical protein